MNGMSVLIKETLESPVPLLPCEDTGEEGVYEPGGGFSPDIKSAGAWILDFPDSKTVGNKYLLCKPPSLRFSVVAAQTD